MGMYPKYPIAFPKTLTPNTEETRNHILRQSLPRGNQTIRRATTQSRPRDIDAAKPVPATVFGLSPQPEASATEINGINVAIRDYRRSYLEYWNRYAEITGTGRSVDVFLMPVAPTPAPARGKVRYFGEKSSRIINEGEENH